MPRFTSAVLSIFTAGCQVYIVRLCSCLRQSVFWRVRGSALLENLPTPDRFSTLVAEACLQSAPILAEESSTLFFQRTQCPGLHSRRFFPPHLLTWACSSISTLVESGKPAFFCHLFSWASASITRWQRRCGCGSAGVPVKEFRFALLRPFADARMILGFICSLAADVQVRPRILSHFRTSRFPSSESWG